VVAGGRHARGPHEAWIAADPFNGGFRVLITGPHGFERTVTFAIDDDPAVIRVAKNAVVRYRCAEERITRYSDIGLEFLHRRCCWPEVALGENVALYG
jgi:hypothetical protein